MPKPTTAAVLLASAVGVPYGLDKSGVDFSQYWPSTAAATAGTSAEAPPQAKLGQPMALPQAEPTDNLAGLIYQSPAPLEGIPTYSLAEVLRMDITREWVYQRWARKSVGLATPDLFGVRVPLVTGTRMTDLAGSLTYYFNSAGQVDRLSFLGNTADATQLVQLLTQQYGLELQPSVVPGEYLYQLKEDENIVSELRIRPESVLWTTTPHDSFHLEMELNRPGSRRYLSRPMPTIDLPQPITAAAPPGKVPVHPDTPLGQVQSNVDQSAAAQAEVDQLDAASKAQAQEYSAAKTAPPAQPAPVKQSAPPRYRWPK